MRLLLDPHALLLALEAPGSLKAEARSTTEHPRNPVLVSAASTWEVGIEIALGKLRVSKDLVAQLREKRFTALPVTVEHGLGWASYRSVVATRPTASS